MLYERGSINIHNFLMNIIDATDYQYE